MLLKHTKAEQRKKRQLHAQVMNMSGSKKKEICWLNDRAEGMEETEKNIWKEDGKKK